MTPQREGGGREDRRNGGRGDRACATPETRAVRGLLALNLDDYRASCPRESLMHDARIREEDWFVFLVFESEYCCCIKLYRRLQRAMFRARSFLVCAC